MAASNLYKLVRNLADAEDNYIAMLSGNNEAASAAEYEHRNLLSSRLSAARKAITDAVLAMSNAEENKHSYKCARLKKAERTVLKSRIGDVIKDFLAAAEEVYGADVDGETDAVLALVAKYGAIDRLNKYIDSL